MRTLLIVAEGYHDEAFLRHVRGFNEVRGCGKVISIRNARGKGLQRFNQPVWKNQPSMRCSSYSIFDDAVALINSAVARSLSAVVRKPPTLMHESTLLLQQ